MKLLLSVFLVFAAIFFAGCLDGVAEMGCGALSGEDRDHCMQGTGVMLNSEYLCAQVKGNAPKDKCFVQLARKYGDPSVCSNVKGLAYGYSKQECLQNAAIGSNNRSICETIEGEGGDMMFSFNRQSCLHALGVN